MKERMAGDDRELRFSRKPAQVSDEEQRRVYIEVMGLSETEANFYMALEQGLIDGDTVALGGEDPPPLDIPVGEASSDGGEETSLAAPPRRNDTRRAATRR